MAYMINDFTGFIIGLFVVYATIAIALKLSPYHNEDAVLTKAFGFSVNSAFSAVFVAVPVLVWYVYQVLLDIGPKGTSKAIKI